MPKGCAPHMPKGCALHTPKGCAPYMPKGFANAPPVQVWQTDSFTAEGQTRSYQVEASGQHALSIALAWLDLPGEVGVFPILTNNLDMKVSVCMCVWVWVWVWSGGKWSGVGRSGLQQSGQGHSAGTVR